jgi:hypothetical protein
MIKETLSDMRDVAVAQPHYIFGSFIAASLAIGFGHEFLSAPFPETAAQAYFQNYGLYLPAVIFAITSFSLCQVAAAKEHAD